MPRLRLVGSEQPSADAPVDVPADVPVDERPRVSLRLLMAASGRCSCDDCLLAYRAGDKTAGIIEIRSSRPPIAAVR